MAKYKKIQIYLTDIIEEFEMPTENRLPMFYFSKTKKERRGGIFLRYDFGDGSTVLISHN